MRTPTDVLRDEHAIILRALDLLERAAGATEGEAPDGWWTEAVSWLRDFADRNHHGKEEDLLFPAMIRAGVPAEGGPVDVMLEEHERGRALVRAMAQSTGAARAARAREYVALLRDHIEKENQVLFPLADAVFSAEEQRTLSDRFGALEAALGKPAAPGRAGTAVEDLAASLNARRLVLHS
jgi:hemerythrin-like domain-containing protein